MSAQPKFDKPWMSVEDYLAAELLSDIKHEYDAGELVAMSSASKNHERIKMSLARLLGNHLQGKPCEPFSSDVKVKIGQYLFYPDAMVVCEDTSTHDYYAEAPVLIVEVLSKSTRRRDETIKRRLYQTIPSLLEYVLIEQDIVDFEVCRRSEGWVSNHYFLGDQARFESVDLTLDVAEIYQRVDNDDMRTFIAEQAAADQASQVQ
ncbi:Uma2 family endonuclease [Methylomonas sp. BW4-1]|uniref:Uma2 family endonuclease n=1 Tax=unclassified Methylomonas TaxID=2608980 RepID=UPI00051C3EC8|nr:Uma2 family endonuclease [Methylomonas sp. LW13]QBC27541.1 Uma2 family endonuclease [Methylomonas sp. LW13]